MQPIINTERLTLRELCHDDLDFVTELLGDAEVTRFHASPYSPEEASAWLERQLDFYQDGKHGMWLVLNRKSGKPVGLVGLVPQTVDGVSETELVYLIHRKHWRHGYATEAAFAVRSLARDRYGYSRVISIIDPDNLPSQGVARRLGMQAKRTLVWNGVQHTLFAASLVASD